MDPITWIYLAMLVISIFVAYKKTKKNDVKPASLQDFDVPTAEAGRDICMCAGDVWIDDPNFLDYFDLRTTPIKADGGK